MQPMVKPYVDVGRTELLWEASGLVSPNLHSAGQELTPSSQGDVRFCGYQRVFLSGHWESEETPPPRPSGPLCEQPDHVLLAYMCGAVDADQVYPLLAAVGLNRRHQADFDGVGVAAAVFLAPPLVLSVR